VPVDEACGGRLEHDDDDAAAARAAGEARERRVAGCRRRRSRCRAARIERARQHAAHEREPRVAVRAAFGRRSEQARDEREREGTCCDA
jgi:hypothetical protein